MTIAAPAAPDEQTPAGPARSRQRWRTAGCWLLVALWAAFSLSRWLGVDGGIWPLMALPAITPYLTLAALGPLALCLLTRRWLAALAALAVVASLLVLVMPRAFGNAEPARGPGLRVLTANLAEGQADPREFVALVREQRVDVLAVSELTDRELARLTRAGLSDLLPYALTNPSRNAAGTGLFSRYPLTGGRAVPLTGGFVETTGTLRLPGARPVDVTAVHYCAPADPGQVSCWEYGRSHIPPATPDGRIRLLLGDFNMTLDYGGLRSVLATGYRDAADVVGQGLVPTWPYSGVPLPKVTIDHVLADRRIGVSGVSVLPIVGSDHQAVFAALTVPKS